METQLQQLQLRAFDAHVRIAPATLTFHGKRAIVAGAPLTYSRMLAEVGIDEVRASAVEMKCTDLDRLELQDKSHVELDGEPMRVLVISREKSDAIANLTLGPRR